MYIEWYDKNEREWNLSHISFLKGIFAYLMGVMAWEKTEKNSFDYDFFRVPKSQIDFI